MRNTQCPVCGTEIRIPKKAEKYIIKESYELPWQQLLNPPVLPWEDCTGNDLGIIFT